MSSAKIYHHLAGRVFFSLPVKVSLTPQPNARVDWRLQCLVKSWVIIGVSGGLSGVRACDRLWVRLLILVADGDHDDRSYESVLISWDRVIVSSHSHPLPVLHSLRTELLGSLLYPVIDRTPFLRQVSLSVCEYNLFCLPMCLHVFPNPTQT